MEQVSLYEKMKLKCKVLKMGWIVCFQKQTPMFIGNVYGGPAGFKDFMKCLSAQSKMIHLNNFKPDTPSATTALTAQWTGQFP